MTEQEQKLSAELQQIRQEKSFAAKLKQEQIYNLVERHKKTILQDFEYDLTNPAEYYAHRDLVRQLGNDYTGREFREFEVDENNSKVLSFLLYYFNGCRLAEKVFPDEDYKIHKNLLIVGAPGTGKTMIMQIFADYLRLTRNPSHPDDELLQDERTHRPVFLQRGAVKRIQSRPVQYLSERHRFGNRESEELRYQS